MILQPSLPHSFKTQNQDSKTLVNFLDLLQSFSEKPGGDPTTKAGLALDQKADEILKSDEVSKYPDWNPGGESAPRTAATTTTTTGGDDDDVDDSFTGLESRSFPITALLDGDDLKAKLDDIDRRRFFSGLGKRSRMTSDSEEIVKRDPRAMVRIGGVANDDDVGLFKGKLESFPYDDDDFFRTANRMVLNPVSGSISFPLTYERRLNARPMQIFTKLRPYVKHRKGFKNNDESEMGDLFARPRQKKMSPFMPTYKRERPGKDVDPWTYSAGLGKRKLDHEHDKNFDPHKFFIGLG